MLTAMVWLGASWLQLLMGQLASLEDVEKDSERYRVRRSRNGISFVVISALAILATLRLNGVG